VAERVTYPKKLTAESAKYDAESGEKISFIFLSFCIGIQCPPLVGAGGGFPISPTFLSLPKITIH
jgi:hypothetical protein